MSADTVAFLQVAAAFLLAYVVTPYLILPRPRGARTALDVVAVNLLRWTAITIVVSHILAAVGVYSTVTVLMLCGVAAWYARFGRRPSEGPDDVEAVDDADARPALEPDGARWRTAAHGVLIAGPGLGVVAAAYWLRVRDVVGTYTLSPPDVYFHMTWAASFARNDLWPDGVYPQGMPAFVALIDVFAPFTHMIDVARFTGPLITVLIVFALYYAVSRLTRSPGAALLAAGAFALFSAAPEWRIPWHRQIGLLSQEFAVAMAILALTFVILAVTERPGGRYLRLGPPPGLIVGSHALTAALGGVAVAMSHPIPAVIFGLAATVGVIASTIVLPDRWRWGAGVLVAAGIGTFAGLSVQLIAQAVGLESFAGHGLRDLLVATSDESRDVIIGQTRLDEEAYWWLRHSWLSIVGGVAAAVGVAGALLTLRMTRRRRYGAQLLALAAVGGLVFVAWDLRPLAPVLTTMYIQRTGHVLGQMIGLGLGAGLGAVLAVAIRRRSILADGIGLVAGIAALGLLATQYAPPTQIVAENFGRETIEYEEMAAATQELRRANDPRSYTVVGITNQLQALNRDGFFIELWVFVRDVTDLPHDEPIPVPSEDTFLFVEMDPFPVGELPPVGAAEEYYFEREKRGRIMATAYRWVEERRRTDDEVQIVFDGDHVRVYRLRGDPELAAADGDVPFTDYTWQPGALFNVGPTSPREVEVTEVGDR